jgi:lipoyl-dependent peroxiredoxin
MIVGPSRPRVRDTTGCCAAQHDRKRVTSHQKHECSLHKEDEQMPATPLSKILYTAEAITEGGRAGHGRTSDGRLEVQLSVPEDMGGQGGPGTNPEQLFALGYAACFQSALLAIAQGHRLDAADSQITARVGIGPTGHGGFGIQVALDLHAPHLPPAEAADLMARADERCPYSNATRGNIEVALSVDGIPIEQAAA